MILRAKKMPYRVEGPARREKSVNALVLTNPFYGLLPKKHSTKVSIDAAIALVENGGSLKALAVPRDCIADFLRPEHGRIASNAVCRSSLGVSGIRKDPDGLEPLRAPPPRYGGLLSLKTLGGSMPKLIRAIRALFPVFAVPISTVPSQAEAHALAVLLVAQGKRVCIHADAQGFAVEVVA